MNKLVNLIGKSECNNEIDRPSSGDDGQKENKQSVTLEAMIKVSSIRNEKSV